MFTKFDRPFAEPGSRVATGLKLLFCIALEILLFVLHYAVYVQTIDMLPLELHQALVDLPLVGFLFERCPELRLSDLLSAVLAAASVLAPAGLWYHVLEWSLFEETGGRAPTAMAKAATWAIAPVYGMLLTLEFCMLYLRILQGSDSAFLDPAAAGSSGHLLFAVFVAVVFVLINGVVAFFTTVFAARLGGQIEE